MLVTVEIPDHVAKELHLDEPTRSRQLLEALLLQRYAEGEITAARVGEALGVSIAETQTFLSSHRAAPVAASGKQNLSKAEWKAELDAWALDREPVKHFVDDSRESIYAGRGE